MADDYGQRTEAPTPRRLDEARREGRIARSSDLMAAVSLAAGVLLLGIAGVAMDGQMRGLLEQMLGSPPPPTAKDAARELVNGIYSGARAVGPVVLGIMLISIVVGLVQSRGLFTAQPLIPRWSRCSPARGIKQIFSLRALVRLAMSLGKLGIVATVTAFSIHGDLPRIAQLVHLEPAPLMAGAAWLIWMLALKIAGVLLMLGLADYAYQRWQHEQDLRMTRTEVKEELKRMEGDPLMRQRRLGIARQLITHHLVRDVSRADVVVTNPAHVAVALRYEEDMAAPKVVARGVEHRAVRIQQIAALHGVPIVERPALARSLCRAAQMGREIPPRHYNAVAEVLAYVYRASGRKIA